MHLLLVLQICFSWLVVRSQVELGFKTGSQTLNDSTCQVRLSYKRNGNLWSNVHVFTANESFTEKHTWYYFNLSYMNHFKK